MPKFVKEIENFMLRLKTLNATPDQATQYTNLYMKLLNQRQDAQASHALALPRIKFAAYRAESKRLLSETRLLQSIATGKKVQFYIINGVEADANLLDKLKEPTVSMPTDLVPFSRITVWQEPDATDRPQLTLNEIVAQIPRLLINKTVAVCLLAEEEDIQNGSYNRFMGMHEYRVWLFKKKAV